MICFNTALSINRGVTYNEPKHVSKIFCLEFHISVISCLHQKILSGLQHKPLWKPRLRTWEQCLLCQRLHLERALRSTNRFKSRQKTEELLKIPQVPKRHLQAPLADLVEAQRELVKTAVLRLRGLRRDPFVSG